MTIFLASGDRVLTSQQMHGRGMGRLGPQVNDAAAPSIPRDGPGNWYRPIQSSHFTDLGLNVPDVLLLCQEAAGALVPTIDTPGAGNWAVSGTGHLYQQTVVGWAAKFVGLDGAINGQRWGTAAAQLDVAAGESYAMIVLASFTAPAGTRNFFAAQGTANQVQGLASGLLRAAHNSTLTSTIASHAGIGTVHQMAWYRRADTNVSGLMTDVEGITSNPHNESAFAGQIKALGSAAAGTGAPASRFGWCAIYKGVNAQFDMSTYLTTMRG